MVSSSPATGYARPERHPLVRRFRRLTVRRAPKRREVNDVAPSSHSRRVPQANLLRCRARFGNGVRYAPRHEGVTDHLDGGAGGDKEAPVNGPALRDHDHGVDSEPVNCAGEHALRRVPNEAPREP